MTTSTSAEMIGYWPRSVSPLVSWHGWIYRLILLLSWDLLAGKNSHTVEANPVKGVLHCLNNEDCVGANRFCFRDTSMTDGICTCRPGFKPAEGNIIRCLNILQMECETTRDCPNQGPCGPPFAAAFTSNMNLFIDDFNLSFGDSKKRCIAIGETIDEMQRGLRLFESFQNFDPHNYRHLTTTTTSSYHGEYIKFVEDAMLVLFLMCILVTLLVVHRATFRNFWRTRRSGPLRYIIPYRDDQPPSYSQTGATGIVTGSATEAGAASSTLAAAEGGVTGEDREMTTLGSCPDTLAKTNRRSETPPPTYDEALLISQSIAESTAESRVSVNPLFIALPESPEATPVGQNRNQGSTLSRLATLGLEPPVEEPTVDEPPEYSSIILR